MIFHKLELALDRVKELFEAGKSVEIKTYYPKRTLAQNRLSWLYWAYLSEQTGYTPDEVKYVFQKRFLEYEKNGYTFIRGTSELNKKEFIEFIDNVIMYASQEMEIELPHPEDYYAIEMLRNELEK